MDYLNYWAHHSIIFLGNSMKSVTREHLEQLINNSEVSYTNPKGTLTHCIITLPHGFTVTGESACVDPSLYNKELGEKYALEKAVDKLWELEGYLLSVRLAEDWYVVA